MAARSSLIPDSRARREVLAGAAPA